MEQLLEEKDCEISTLRTSNESSVTLLKKTLNAKNIELESLKVKLNIFWPAFTCSKPIIETPAQCAKSAQSQ